MKAILTIVGAGLACSVLFACGGGVGQESVPPKTSTVKGGIKKAQATTIPTSRLDQTPTGFFYPIGKADFDQECGTWLGRDSAHGGCYFDGYYHVGVDMMTYSLDANAYAIADGQVVYISSDTTSDGSNWGIGNCAVVIEHKTSDESVFTAVYGHLKCATVPAKNSDVYAGKPIGKTGPWSNGIHLHFSIHNGPFSGGNAMSRSGWGKMPNGSWPDQNTFTDPLDFIRTKSAYNPSVEQQVDCQGNICWYPRNVSCEAASSWFKGSSYPVVQTSYPWMYPVGSEVCGELRSKLDAIADAPNPHEAIPEDGWWRNFWRFVRNLLGETASAAEIAQALRSEAAPNVINVYTGNVVAGSAAKATHGTGMGYVTNGTGIPISSLPDFITTKVWLTTPWGVETYKYGLAESFDTKAQSKNVGDGFCLSGESTTTTGHFYLSKGYKEDPHSGDGAWRRLDSTTTQCDNLEPGETHTETKNTKISDWITTPGIYNVVYCQDHPLDDHNEGGDHRERYESNNCSTEAVFEVTANQIENVPQYDLIVSSVQVIGTPLPVPSGGLMGGKMAIRNIGNATSPVGIRSSYSICLADGMTQCVLKADDGSDAAELSPGRDQWEETKALFQAPTSPGLYALKACADYQNALAEVDEMNNCSLVTFEVQPPRPDFIVTAVGPAGGNYSIKAGSRFYPAMYIKNIGNANPTSGIRGKYEYSGPATNYQWVYITDDGTDAGQLCVGCQYREQYDGGMKIYTRGTYSLRGCADYLGWQTESNEANNCTVSASITIY